MPPKPKRIWHAARPLFPRILSARVRRTSPEEPRHVFDLPDLDAVVCDKVRSRARFDEVLVLWEGGHGLGTIAWELHDAVELIDRLGLRYRRHVVGTDDEVFHKGRPVDMEPDRLGRIPSMQSAFDKLELVTSQARDRSLAMEISFRLPEDSF